MSSKDESTDIVELAPTPVRPLVSPEQAAKEWQKFEELKKRLLTKSDYATINGKPHECKSAFRKLAVYFGISDEIVEQVRTDREDDSFMWRIVVKATAPNGRFSTGVGICDSRERDFARVEHDVYSTAHTRAKNRAISDLVAGGVVSAEEMGAVSEKSAPDSSSAIGNESLSKEDIADALQGAGLETSILGFHEENGVVTVTVQEFIKDRAVWNQYNEAMRDIGYVWSKENGKGHWRPAEVVR